MLDPERLPPAASFPPWKPGQSGNPKGRPKGSRNKVTEMFWGDLHAVWQDQGEAALRRCAFHKPEILVQVMAKLMPAKLEIDVGPTDGISLERMEQLIALAERMASLRNGAPASVTIEGHALEVEGGGGSPHDALTRGEVIEVVHTSSAPPNPVSTVSTPSPNTRPDFSAAPHATPLSSKAEVPDAGPADFGGPAAPLDEEDDIDPMSLF